MFSFQGLKKSSTRKARGHIVNLRSNFSRNNKPFEFCLLPVSSVWDIVLYLVKTSVLTPGRTSHTLIVVRFGRLGFNRKIEIAKKRLILVERASRPLSRFALELPFSLPLRTSATQANAGHVEFIIAFCWHFSPKKGKKRVFFFKNSLTTCYLWRHIS